MLASFIAAGKNWSESRRRVSVRQSVASVSGQLPVEEQSRASFDRARYRAFTVAGSADKKRSLIEHERLGEGKASARTRVNEDNCKALRRRETLDGRPEISAPNERR